MRLPARIERQRGRHALVDGIPFELPIDTHDSSALVAGFFCNPERAQELLPGNELHAVRVFGRGLFLVSVMNYRRTDIGTYIEYSIGVACTRGRRPLPAPLALGFPGRSGFGQFVYDLPVSTEISVKGGRGIWGMPKRQANLDYLVTDASVSTQYDLEGQLAMRVDLRRPKFSGLPIRGSSVAYCNLRGMLWKSYLYFKGRGGFSLRRGAARLTIGDSPRMDPVRSLEVDPRSVFAAFLPDSSGVLDDHVESWFLGLEDPPVQTPEGLETVVALGLGTDWLAPPNRHAEHPVSAPTPERAESPGGAREVRT